MLKRAVIYCRVASASQAVSNDPFEDQKRLCLWLAALRNYSVQAFYHDVGSGNERDRPGLSALLDICASSNSPDVVLVADLVRLARDKDLNLQLRMELRRKGVSVEAASGPSGGDADHDLVKAFLSKMDEHMRLQYRRHFRKS